MKSILILTIIALFFTACKKDKLTGDYEKLVGEWQWIESSGGHSGMTFDPSTTNSTRQLVFIKRGRYKVFENGKKSEAGRVIIEPTDNSYADFIMDLKPDLLNKEKAFSEQLFITFVGADTLILYDSCSDCFQHNYIRLKD